MAILENQSWQDYCDVQRMNASTLVAGCHSMKRLKRAIDGGFPEETNSMRFGTGLHALLLEPDEFEERFVVMPAFENDSGNLRKPKRKTETEEERRTTSKSTDYYKARVREFAKQHAGRAILERTQYDKILHCIEAIRSRPKMNEVIDSSQKEVSIEGELFDIPFKGRLDLLRVGRRALITDVKCTGNVQMFAFGRVFANLHYGFKMAIYRELVRNETGKDASCAFICQEPDGDFDNTYVPIPAVVLDNAWDKVVRVIGEYKKSQASGEWPGVDGGKDEYSLHIPNWAMDEDDEELDWSQVPEAHETAGAPF